MSFMTPLACFPSFSFASNSEYDIRRFKLTLCRMSSHLPASAVMKPGVAIGFLFGALLAAGVILLVWPFIADP